MYIVTLYARCSTSWKVHVLLVPRLTPSFCRFSCEKGTRVKLERQGARLSIFDVAKINNPAKMFEFHGLYFVRI